METSTVPLKASRLTANEDALASQVLEIIGGITRVDLQTPEEPEDRHVWSTEEGDDSVFYSDDDRAHQDVIPSCGFGANGCERLVNSVAADEDDPREELIIGEEIAALETEVTQQVILTEQEEERQELQTPRAEPADPADPGAVSNRTPEKSMSTSEGSLNCTIANMQTQQYIPAETAVEKEEVTPNREPPDVTNEESYTRLNGEAEVSEQNSCAELQMSGDRRLQADPEQDHDFHVPVGFHQNPRPGYSTLPLPKKSSGGAGGHQKSFNHLSSSRYSTVSYRKIRRGNTREKIQEFEYMIMNL